MLQSGCTKLLNFPELLLPGYAISDVVPLALYASSRANQSFYCTSHCCSFAMRRGVDPTTLEQDLDALMKEGDNTVYNPRELAVIRVAYGLGTVPPCLDPKDVATLQKQMSRPETEWIVAATAMMGDLNKLMDGLNIPLEKNTYGETMAHIDDRLVRSEPVSIGLGELISTEKKPTIPVPPRDDWTLKLAVLYHGLRPGGALALDAKLLQGIPTKAEDCLKYLKDLSGFNFAVLGKLRHERFRRALTAILARNLVTDGIQLHTKILIGIQYCKVLQNEQLRIELEANLGNLPKITAEPNEELLMKAAKALFCTPNRLTAATIDLIDASSLTAQNIIELVSFLAALQSLHRIETYYKVSEIAKD